MHKRYVQGYLNVIYGKSVSFILKGVKTVLVVLFVLEMHSGFEIKE